MPTTATIAAMPMAMPSADRKARSGRVRSPAAPTRATSGNERRAGFLVALQRVDPAGGPTAGRHNFFRGGPLQTYDGETRRAIGALHARIPGDTATAIWQTALQTTWNGSPVWLHGDVAQGNLLVKGGMLAAVIDFGTSGIGDPACDMVIAWTLLSGVSRETFRASQSVDSATWARGRGWALWKALTTYDKFLHTDATKAATARYVIDQVLAEYEQSI
jgi:aminoglycoside phosphotransferase (APT) family kinase protein